MHARGSVDTWLDLEEEIVKELFLVLGTGEGHGEVLQGLRFSAGGGQFRTGTRTS